MTSIALILALGGGVATASVDISAKIAAAVSAHVAAEMAMDIADVEVESVGFSASHGCSSDVEIKVQTLPGEQFRGQTQLKIRMIDSGNICGRYSVSSRIILWKDVPVAQVAARPGDPITFKSARVDISKIRGVLVDPAIGEWVAARSLRAGQPVTMRFAKRKPATSNGQAVSIVAQFGSLQIMAKGRMLVDAQIGDWVRVANLATDTVVQGQLIAPTTVRTGGRP